MPSHQLHPSGLHLNYKTCLIKFQLFPLMYILEISKITFFITSVKNPTPTGVCSFNINMHISFSSNHTRSSGVKLNHNPTFNNKQCHFYLNHICRLRNALPVIKLDFTIKNQIKSFLWKYFVTNFNPTDPNKLHYLCPCSSCTHCFTNFDHINSLN